MLHTNRSAPETDLAMDPVSAHTRGRGLDADGFRRVMGSLPAGVTIVTSRDAEGHPKGLTVSACSSVSLEPPLLLVCVDRRSSSLQAIKATGVFAVNILRAGQQDLAARFASRREDRFTDVSCLSGRLDLPVLEGTVGHAECELFAVVDAGDHAIVIGLIVDGDACDAVPLLYFRRQYGAWPEVSS